MQNDNQAAIKEMLKSFAYLLEQAKQQTTQCYDGIIISQSENTGKWNVKYNGIISAMKPYGSVIPAIGKLVKVIIPQGNASVAFFI